MPLEILSRFTNNLLAHHPEFKKRKDGSVYSNQPCPKFMNELEFRLGNKDYDQSIMVTIGPEQYF